MHRGRRNATRMFALGAAVALLLGACARSTPAPVIYRQSAMPAPVARQDVLVLAPIPARKPLWIVRAAAAPPVPMSPPRMIAQPAPVQLTAPRSRRDVTEHRVVSGDTIYSISKRYGIQARELVAANGLPAPYDIRIGQLLRLPGHAMPPPAPEPEATVLASLGGVPTPASKPVYWRPLAPPPPRSEALFAWPTRGQLLSAFGGKPGGLRNDGINIAAPEGTAVRAAEAGIVAYVGNELRGFGNLLLVRHSDGWMSAYAHIGEIAVSRGDRVERGQVIARVGRTGRIDRPQLHFELRKGSTPVDPMRYLAPNGGAPARAVSRDVRLAGLPNPE